MAKIGLSLNKLTEEERKVADEALSFIAIALSEDRGAFDRALKDLTATLLDAAEGADALLALKLERLCIAVEQALKGQNSDILNKQISRSGDAEISLKLVQDPATYRAHVDMLFPYGVQDIPRGEGMNTFVNAQLSYLGIGKRYFFAMESARTDYYSARQATLRGGLRSFQELQRAALFPEA